MKKVCLLLFLHLLLHSYVKGQQDPEYTQYMYNMSIINPAYATNNVGVVNTGLLYRSQWVGAVGAPKTATAFVRTPINDRIELGISFINDAIGDGALSENNIATDFAYLIQLSRDTHLSFGLKTGITIFDTQFSDFQLNSGNFNTDPSFAQNMNETFLNMGAGVFLFSDKYYAGLSVPAIFRTKSLSKSNGEIAIDNENLHFFATAGYVFDIHRDLEIKPSIMIRSTLGAPLSIDLNTNVRFQGLYEFGLSYRFKDAISAMFNIGITEQLAIGYAYDYTTSNLGNFNSGSHEIILLYNFHLSRSKRYSSPRFF